MQHETVHLCMTIIGHGELQCKAYKVPGISACLYNIIGQIIIRCTVYNFSVTLNERFKVSAKLPLELIFVPYFAIFMHTCCNCFPGTCNRGGCNRYIHYHTRRKL